MVSFKGKITILKFISFVSSEKICVHALFLLIFRLNKIKVLCRVMGLPEVNFDPDPTYELTIDNMKKMLAIHMRLR